MNYFSDYFKVDPQKLKEFGAFNISLITDLPLFIDPFLLFNSEKSEYRKLHEDIIRYLIFLKEKSSQQTPDTGKLKSWYVFSEVKENWLGYSAIGNKGHALGMEFARALNESLYSILNNFGKEKITESSHLEKICIVRSGVGKDSVSDLTTNLIKKFLLEYTQLFAKEHIDKGLRGEFRVPKVHFNYETETWEESTFDLPKFENSFVILTPKDLLTKDETWINRKDMYGNFTQIPNAIDNDHLRSQVNNYFQKRLSQHQKQKKRTGKREKGDAATETIRKFPELIDYYIKHKEKNRNEAESISKEKVSYSESVFVKNAKKFTDGLGKIGFYSPLKNSHSEARKRILDLKSFIEDNDGYKLLHHKGERIASERDLQILFYAICYSSPFDTNREVNNGRGAVDFTISTGRAHKTLIEFKLASNNKLKQGLQKQIEIYQRANRTRSFFIVIVFFSEAEHKRVIKILEELNLDKNENIIIIDARNDKKSASRA